MANKILKIILFTFIIISLYKCGKGAACAGNSIFISKDDLVIITPIQTTYNQGDLVTVKVTIPSNLTLSLSIAGESIVDITDNIIGEFGFSQYLDTNRNLFTGNMLTFVKGAPSNKDINLFVMPYNFQTGEYEFEMKVKLNRLGTYRISTLKNKDLITIKGPNECDTVNITTNKQNPNNIDEIIFTVI